MEEIEIVAMGPASLFLGEVDALAAKLADAEGSLEHGYARLGWLLVQVSRNEYWRAGGHGSFGQYIRAVGDKYNRKRTQLYHYFSTVKELAPYVAEGQLDAMGISKAAELKRGLKRTGRLPAEAVERASEPGATVADVQRLLFEGENPPPADRGTWYDQEGFYATADERKVIDAADEAALRLDPPVQPDSPAWVRRKEARLRQAMEFLSQYPTLSPGWGE